MNNTGQLGGTVDADIDTPEAWDLASGDGSVVVGIIDTGIAYDHPDLAGNMWTNLGEVAADGIDNDANGYVDDVYGYDFVGANDPNPYDDHGHGTHVAGTVAAVGNNSVGVAGVNWNAKVMALKFLGSGGSGTTADAIEAVNYATMMRNRGVNIRLTNNSWGGGAFDQALMDAIAASGNAGMLFVAAADNNGMNTDVSVSYPQGYNLPNIISVAATDRFDQRASFSNYGATSVDIGAPGVDILSTALSTSDNIWDPSGYVAISGTSMASPHVAGVAALAWGVSPGATYQQVRPGQIPAIGHAGHVRGQHHRRRSHRARSGRGQRFRMVVQRQRHALQQRRDVPHVHRRQHRLGQHRHALCRRRRGRQRRVERHDRNAHKHRRRPGPR